MQSNSNRKITALYCRLSQEDMREGDSVSIENQKNILQKYAVDNGFHNCKVYVDDGYSGANFNRPAYKEMMYEVECGNVSTVIVKDQSRLGRDYLQTGMLMEVIFPQYDVRFIAINDGVDSDKGINDFSGIKNYFNDLYARDTSKKIRAVKRAIGERGERVGTTIPSNQTYCGDTVNFKTYSKSNKLKKRIKNSPENILIFKDTHEAIIDRKTFDLVQKHFEGRKRPDKQGEMDKYAGYLYCGECGSRLYLHRAKTMKPEQNNFMCGGYQSRTTDCTSHYIREQVLDKIVLEQLKTMTAKARENTEEFYAMASQNGEAEAKKFYRQTEREKQQIETRISQVENIIRCLYEDRATGRITPERYDTMASGYEQEQEELTQELKSITDKISEMDMHDIYVKEFISKAKEYIEMPKLTPELLRTFIRRIEVFEKEEKYSRTCGNTIKIYYTFQI